MTKRNINKENLKLIDEVLDEIVDVIIKSKTSKEEKEPSKLSEEEMENLKLRLRELGRRIEEHIESAGMDAVESRRLLSEKIEEIINEQEKSSMHLEGDIGELSNKLKFVKSEVKRLKKKVNKY